MIVSLLPTPVRGAGAAGTTSSSSTATVAEDGVPTPYGWSGSSSSAIATERASSAVVLVPTTKAALTVPVRAGNTNVSGTDDIAPSGSVTATVTGRSPGPYCGSRNASTWSVSPSAARAGTSPSVTTGSVAAASVRVSATLGDSPPKLATRSHSVGG